jgi:hypothetical protein
VIRESSIFLMSKKKVKELKEVLRYIAGVNGKEENLDSKFDELGERDT